MTVTEEIGEMLKSLTVPDSTDVEVREEEKEIENKEEVESEESKTEVKESEVKEPEETKVDEVATEPKEEPKAPELDEKDKLIEELRAKLAEKEAKKEEPKPEPKPELIGEQDFVGDQDFDELTRDPKQLNAIFNKVYQKAVSDTRQSMLNELPNMVRSNVEVINTVRSVTEQFYEENSDLKGFKKVVAVTFEEMAKENPTKSFADIMKAVAPEVRKRLELTKKVGANGKEKKADPPKLPTKGAKAGSSQSKQSVNPLQDELDEMSKTLGR